MNKPCQPSSWSHRPLRRILDPVTPEVFARDVFATQALHLPAPEGESGRFETLFGWAALNQLLSLGAESGPGIKIFKDKSQFVYKRVPDTLSKIMAEVRSGATMLLDQVDRLDQQLAAFADALSDELSSRVMINLYLSSPAVAGFPRHYDTHDFFILQIAGYKQWDIYPATISHPNLLPPLLDPRHPGVQPPPDSSRLQRLMMAPGDVLYVPKGFWHEALAVQETSLHLTVGLHVSTGIDLMTYLISELLEQPAFRAPLPLIDKASLPVSAQGPEAWLQHFQTLKQELQVLLDQPGLMKRFHQHSLSSLDRRLAFDFPWVLARTPESLAGISRFKVAQVPHLLSLSADGQVELVYARQKMQFAAAALDLLRYIFQQQQLTREQLLVSFPAFAWQDLLEVLLPLVQDGLLIPDPNPDFD